MQNKQKHTVIKVMPRFCSVTSRFPSLSAAFFVPSGFHQEEFHQKLPGAEPCGQTGRSGVSGVVSDTV